MSRSAPRQSALERGSRGRSAIAEQSTTVALLWAGYAAGMAAARQKEWHDAF